MPPVKLPLPPKGEDSTFQTRIAPGLGAPNRKRSYKELLILIYEILKRVSVSFRN